MHPFGATCGLAFVLKLELLYILREAHLLSRKTTKTKKLMKKAKKQEKGRIGGEVDGSAAAAASCFLTCFTHILDPIRIPSTRFPSFNRLSHSHSLFRRRSASYTVVVTIVPS